MKFKVGDKVVVREDLVAGKTYYHEDGSGKNDFSYLMEGCKGKQATITSVEFNKYALDIDGFFSYTDEMLRKYEEVEEEDLIHRPYEYNQEVEDLVVYMLRLAPQQLINDAIDKGNKEGFIKLTNYYYPKDEIMWEVK